MSCHANRGQKVKAEIDSKCTRKRRKLFKVSELKESESYLLLFIVSSFNRYLSISVRQKPCFRMENKKLLEKLSQMRKNFVADRVRDKQDLVYAIQFLEYQIGVEGGLIGAKSEDQEAG